MTPVRKTVGILAIAGAVAVGAFFLTRAEADHTVTPTPPPTRVAGVTLGAHLQSSHVLFGTNETHLAVTITAPTVAGGTKRPDVNVAVVLDRSGSMSGEKLAQAKAAARQLVSQLAEADRFAIVVYGSDVDTVFPSAAATPAAKSAALATIDRIYDDGGTNLSGGLIAGRSQVLSATHTGAVSRIVLISDGKANEGIVSQDELAQLAQATAEQGVSITTVGVGLDFDEHIMTRIATSGRGNYYFAENANMLAELFTKEFQNLGATVTTNGRLTISPADGVEVLEAYGYPMSMSAGSVLVPISDLHSGETRKVVLRLRVDANHMGAIDLANIELAFTDSKTDQAHQVSTRARAEVTRDYAQVRQGYKKDAVVHIERARTAKALEEATTAYERGDYQGATRILDGRQAEAASMADEADAPALKTELGRVNARAKGNFAAAPQASGSTSGKKARKSNRMDAYKLAK